MKLTLLFLGLLLPIFIIAQDNGLTEDEYNYIVKGFPYQKEMGLDPEKKGLRWEDIKAVNLPCLSFTNDQIDFRAFYKTGKSSPVGIQIKFKDGKYFCIPNPESKCTVYSTAISQISRHVANKGSNAVAELVLLIMSINEYYKYDGNYPSDFDEKFYKIAEKEIEEIKRKQTATPGKPDKPTKPTRGY